VGQACPTFCSSLGKTNLPTTEDATGDACISGEDIAPSAHAEYLVGRFTFPYGCLSVQNGVCAANAYFIRTQSYGDRCYGTLYNNPSYYQKRDNDATDITVACCCK
jgi:hypothetical protein